MNRKWYEYLLEVIVIIGSIIGAFALDRWNDSQSEAKKEKSYLSSLKIDLQKDLQQLSSMREFREGKIESCKTLLNFSSESDFENQEIFFQNMVNVFLWLEFSPNNNTIKELISTGNLSMIKNKAITDRIMSLDWKLEELYTLRDHSRREFDKYLYDRLGLYIDLNEYTSLEDFTAGKRWEIDSAKIAGNTKELQLRAAEFLSDKVVRNGLFLAGANNQVILDLYEGIREEVEMLVRDIDKQISL